MSSESRRIRQEAQSKPKFSNEKPTDDSGKNGDLIYVRNGNGVEEFVKDEGRWLSLQTGRPVEEKAYINRVSSRRTGGGGVVASASVAGSTGNHNLLSNLNDDDHSQYVHITSNRTISATHSFTSSTSFANIDVNGGDIASGTTINKSPVVNFNSGDVTGSLTLSALASGTGSLTIGSGVVGNTELEYDTGQHLKTDSDPSFNSLTLTASLKSPRLISDGDITLEPSGEDVLPLGNSDIDMGDYNRKWRTLFASELYVETLVAQDVLATIGGRIMVAPTTKIIADVSTGATTIDVEHNNIGGKYVIMKTAPAGNAQQEVFKISSSSPSSISGGYRYSITSRNLDGTGANAWVEGDAVCSLGSSAGEGFIDLTSTSTLLNHAGPTMSIYSRTGSSNWNDLKPTVSVGQLSSFVDYSGNDKFGIAIGNDITLSPTNGFKGLTADNTNGLRMFNTPIELYNSAEKRAKFESTGVVKLGRYIDNTASGTEALKFHWDGSSLTVNGTITIANPEDINTGDLNHNAGWTQNQSDATTNNAINAKSKIFYQTSAPSSGHSTNDVWYDTDGGYKRYVYNGSSWINSSDTTYDQSGLITNAQNTANARNTTFFQTTAPTALAIGDLWVDTDDNNKLWRASAANNSSWQAATPDPDVNTTTIVGNTVTTGFINALDVTALQVNASWVYAGSLTANQIQVAGNVFSATKNYNFRGSTNSWSPANCTFNSTTTHSVLDHTSGDARIVSPTFSPAINGEINRYVKIKFRRQGGTGWDGRVYYNGNSGTYSDSRYKSIPETGQTVATSTYTTVMLDMHDLTVGSTSWKTDSAITNIRVDLGSTSSDEFDIEFISIGDVTDGNGTYIDSDGIYTGTLNADNINAGTMTGRTVQTTGGATKLDDTSDFGNLSPPESQSGSTQFPSNSGTSVPPSNPASIAAADWSGYGTLCIRFGLKCTNIYSGGVDYGVAKIQARKNVNGTWSDYGQPQYVNFIGSSYANYEVNYSTQALDDAEIDNILLLITEDDAPPYSSSGYGQGSGSLITSSLTIRQYKYIRITQLTEINRAGFRTYATSNNYAKFGSGGSYFKGSTSISGNLNVYGEAYKLVSGSWLSTSDKRLKNINGDFKKGLSTIKNIDIVNYEYKHDKGKEYVGIIAQELEKVLPEAVSEKVAMGYEDLKVVNESPVLWTLVNAVKELSDKLDKVDKRCKCGRK